MESVGDLSDPTIEEWPSRNVFTPSPQLPPPKAGASVEALPMASMDEVGMDETGDGLGKSCRQGGEREDERERGGGDGEGGGEDEDEGTADSGSGSVSAPTSDGGAAGGADGGADDGASGSLGANSARSSSSAAAAAAAAPPSADPRMVTEDPAAHPTLDPSTPRPTAAPAPSGPGPRASGEVGSEPLLGFPDKFEFCRKFAEEGPLQANALGSHRTPFDPTARPWIPPHALGSW